MSSPEHATGDIVSRFLTSLLKIAPEMGYLRIDDGMRLESDLSEVPSVGIDGWCYRADLERMLVAFVQENPHGEPAEEFLNVDEHRVDPARVTVETLIWIDGKCDDLEALAAAAETHLVRIFRIAPPARYYVQPRALSLKIGLNFDSASPDEDWERATDASLKATQEALNETGAASASARIGTRSMSGL